MPDLAQIRAWRSRAMDGKEAPGGDMIAYHGDLHADLEPWHAYVVDCGHSILAAVRGRFEGDLEGRDLSGMLQPVPVRTVLRLGWATTDLGFVVVDVDWHPDYGPQAPEAEYEYDVEEYHSAQDLDRLEDDDEDGEW